MWTVPARVSTAWSSFQINLAKDRIPARRIDISITVIGDSVAMKSFEQRTRKFTSLGFCQRILWQIFQADGYFCFPPFF
jgi:hypothetical protein